MQHKIIRIQKLLLQSNSEVDSQNKKKLILLVVKFFTKYFKQGTYNERKFVKVALVNLIYSFFFRASYER